MCIVEGLQLTISSSDEEKKKLSWRRKNLIPHWQVQLLLPRPRRVFTWNLKFFTGQFSLLGGPADYVSRFRKLHLINGSLMGATTVLLQLLRLKANINTFSSFRLSWFSHSSNVFATKPSLQAFHRPHNAGYNASRPTTVSTSKKEILNFHFNIIKLKMFIIRTIWPFLLITRERI